MASRTARDYALAHVGSPPSNAGAEHRHLVRHERRLPAQRGGAHHGHRPGSSGLSARHPYPQWTSGWAVANALAALEAGASHVQAPSTATANARATATSPASSPNVALKLKKTCVPAASLPKLRDSRSTWMRLPISAMTPASRGWAATAFAHKGGMHVNAVQKVARSFEHIDPALVGNSRRVLVSDLAGKSNIVMKAQELGFKIHPDTPELKAILARIKELEHRGYEFEAAEASLALLIRKILKHEEPPFSVDALPRLDAPRQRGVRRGSHGQGARGRPDRPHGR